MKAYKQRLDKLFGKRNTQASKARKDVVELTEYLNTKRFTHHVVIGRLRWSAGKDGEFSFWTPSGKRLEDSSNRFLISSHEDIDEFVDAVEAYLKREREH